MFVRLFIYKIHKLEEFIVIQRQSSLSCSLLLFLSVSSACLAFLSSPPHFPSLSWERHLTRNLRLTIASFWHSWNYDLCLTFKNKFCVSWFFCFCFYLKFYFKLSRPPCNFSRHTFGLSFPTFSSPSFSHPSSYFPPSTPIFLLPPLCHLHLITVPVILAWRPSFPLSWAHS